MHVVLVHVPRSGGRSIECTLSGGKFRKNDDFMRLARATASGFGRQDFSFCCGGHDSFPQLRAKALDLQAQREADTGDFLCIVYLLMMRRPARGGQNGLAAGAGGGGQLGGTQ